MAYWTFRRGYGTINIVFSFDEEMTFQNAWTDNQGNKIGLNETLSNSLHLK